MRLVLALTSVAALTTPTLAQDAGPPLPPEVDAAPPTEAPAEDAPPPADASPPADAPPPADTAPPPEPIELGAGDGARAADKGTFGLGLILGEPTGITAKLYLADDQAIQAAAGFAFIGGGLHLHADYVFHPYILQTRDSFVLPVYVGPGVRLIDYSDGRDDHFLALGVRAVGGLLFDFTEIPLDAFVEVAGVLEYGFDADEGFGLALNAAAGARFYF